MIVDSRIITGITHANDNRLSTSGAWRARGHAATPEKHPAAAHKADDGYGQQRQPMRRSELSHSDEPRAGKFKRAERQGKGAARRRAERGSETAPL